MSWYSHLGEYIPGVNVVDDIAQGDWRGAGANLATGGLYGPVHQGVTDVRDAAGFIKDKLNAPYDEKKRGYDAIIAQAGQLKQERIARQQATLAASQAQLNPTRAALQSIYGDPTTWKL